jgi:Aspartyl protease
MNIRVLDGLPFIAATVTYQGRQITLDRVLLDTGSMGSIFSVDQLAGIGLTLELNDDIEQIRGVGGAEFVFTKRVDHITADALKVVDFEIEVGAMSYGFDIEGIVGMDFLTRTRAVIDLSRLEIYPATFGKE